MKSKFNKEDKKHAPNQNPCLFQVSLKALLKNDNNEYLILKDISKSKNWKNKFDLPGGRINLDEIKLPFHKLLDREIREEIGHKVKYQLRKDPVSLSKCNYPGEPCKIFILFEARYLSGKIIISPEHSYYKWEKINKTKAKKIFSSVLFELMSNYFSWNK